MAGENQVFEQAMVMFPEGTSDRWQKVTDHVNGRQLDRFQVCDPVNGTKPCQLNLQVLCPPMTLQSAVGLRRPPMFKIRSPPHRPPTMFETTTPGRGVQRKKQTPRNRRRVQMKRLKLEIATGELNAQFERLFSLSGTTPSYTTNRDDIEELSAKTSQINITSKE